MRTTHAVTYDDDGDRYFWECSCGIAGSGPMSGDMQEHAEHHIPYHDHMTTHWAGERYL